MDARPSVAQRSYAIDKWSGAARRRSLNLRFLLAVPVGFLAATAYADANRDALAELVKCADIADSAERLKCFDAAVTHAKSALASPAPVPKEKSLLEWFGLVRPSPPVTKPEDFGRPPPEAAPGQELTEIRSSVIEFARTLRGKCVFILDNGQVWRQLDADSTNVRDPAEGTKMIVTIETGLLGSYNLSIEGRNGSIKVTRLK